MTNTETKLEVEDLSVRFATRDGLVDAVRGVSFKLGREKLAIVGESGSGKSTVGRTLLKLHPASARIDARVLRFGDTDLLQAGEKQMRAIRGQRMSMIMQDPKYSLNPVMKVGDQIAEALVAHESGRRLPRAEVRERVIAMLEQVRIREPQRVYERYPHEISGGMGQRIMIAMMLIPNPEVVIADEPTSALDVSVRAQVLSVLDDLVGQRDLGLVFISHDLNLVRHFCDRVLVMYAGRVVESIAAADLDHAQHPYTRGLLAALPSIDVRRPALPVLQRDPAWLTN
ncbi:ATP-binding cassette domain-containing protein [Massilia sp. FT127W]|uniref:ATP-binding cassette domain-containing protein n=2 Tax=Pseudoduganella aquatica TaxID=2660641 RepID=A0A7X4KLG5_9BURK|nr:ABC transporter ATP-binding protein [Pseudoduganella aquatica]MYN08199.1 ATP-binding cassette domain-containing protein [Pseudoduganella aquatica]